MKKLNVVERCDHLYSLYYDVAEADGSVTWIGECIPCGCPGAMNVDHDFEVLEVA